MKKEKITDDEKIFAALSYVFPFQLFIYFMSKPAGLYTPFFKKHFKNSCIFYGIIFVLGLIAFLIKGINLPESLQVFRNILLVLMFIASISILCLIFIKAIKIFESNN